MTFTTKLHFQQSKRGKRGIISGPKLGVLGEENTSKPLTPFGPHQQSKQKKNSTEKNRGENEETFALSDFVWRGKKT